MTDVAAAVGLSPTTVSQVLNGKGSFPDRTRQRVLDTADQMGYRRNRLASALRTGRTMTVGLILSAADDPVWSSQWAGVTSEILRDSAYQLNNGGYALMVIPKGKTDWISTDVLDALILSDTAWDDSDLEAALNAGLPVVTNDRLFDDRITIHVDSGYGSMTHRAMDVLSSRGCQRPALFAEPNSLASDATAETAYLEWCEKHDVEPLVENSDYARETLELNIRNLIDRGADAIFSFVGEGLRIKATLDTLAHPDAHTIPLITAELGSGAETVNAGITTIVYHANRGAMVSVPLLVDILNGTTSGPLTIETGWELIEPASTAGG